MRKQGIMPGGKSYIMGGPEGVDHPCKVDGRHDDGDHPVMPRKIPQEKCGHKGCENILPEDPNDRRKIGDETVCEDCWTKEMGKEIDKHPIGVQRFSAFETDKHPVRTERFSAL